MRLHRLTRGITLRLLACLLVAAVSLVPTLASADDGGFYQETKLVSDLPGVAAIQDANLVNAWGLSHGPATPWWVSDNGTGVSTLYQTPLNNGNVTVTALPLVVIIPPPPGGTPPAKPTGNVFNAVRSTRPNEFVVTANGKSGPSFFIFATEDGTLSGWNPQVDGTHAILAANRSSVAIYKGLATGQSHGRDFLYATNFHLGTVEMFDAQFHLVRSFTDRKLAANCPLPGQCYAPFGIQNIEGRLYVTFALQDANREDDVAGAGNGFVDVFNTDGILLRRFAAHGPLNSPWGLALAPGDFGRFSGDLLVGNFGDGRINAYDRYSGKFRGQLKDRSGQPITNDGLWAIAFGNDAQAGPHNQLFFSAGPNDEANGLFGRIQAMNTDR